MKKLIVLDLDGTLLTDEGIIPQNTISYLNSLQDKGHILVLASGRPYRSMIRFVSHFNKEIILISENGGNINSSKNTLFKEIKRFKKKDFLNMFTSNKSIIKSAFYSIGNKAYIYNRLQKLEPFYHIDDNTIVIEGAYDEIENFESPNGALFIVDASKRGEFEDYIKNNKKIKYRLMGYDTKNAIYEISISLFDKAYTIKMLLKHYKISKKNLIVFGDGENDIKMIKLSKMGIAMKNAYKTVKDSASYITEYDNNNEGVYHFLNKILK